VIRMNPATTASGVVTLSVFRLANTF
jgi:hypothetical protein